MLEQVRWNENWAFKKKIDWETAISLKAQNGKKHTANALGGFKPTYWVLLISFGVERLPFSESSVLQIIDEISRSLFILVSAYWKVKLYDTHASWSPVGWGGRGGASTSFSPAVLVILVMYFILSLTCQNDFASVVECFLSLLLIFRILPVKFSLILPCQWT